ncbi:Uncharacterised protein [Vibrio cholerae]|nr:Uncharacterised protein [Vibrio cholerae]
MISTIEIRWCEEEVSRRRSIASITVFRAVK